MNCIDIMYVVYKVSPTNDNLWFCFRGKVTETGSLLFTATRQNQLAGQFSSSLPLPSPQRTHKGERHTNMSFKGKPRASAHARSASPEITSFLNDVWAKPPGEWHRSRKRSGLWTNGSRVGAEAGALSSPASPWASPPNVLFSGCCSFTGIPRSLKEGTMLLFFNVDCLMCW